MIDELNEPDEQESAKDEVSDAEIPLVPVPNDDPPGPYENEAPKQAKSPSGYTRKALKAISVALSWIRRILISSEFWTAAATVAIAITSYLQWKAINGQLREMQGSSSQTDQIICAANKIESDLNAANDQNKAALAQTLSQSKAAMDASNKQSKAVLDATIAASHLDERPWVTAASFQLSAEPSLDPKGFTVTVNVVNTGKTPALDVTPEFKIDFAPSGEIPAPTYVAAAVQNRAILAPGVTTSSFTTGALVLARAQQVDAYTSKSHRIWFQALIRYKDTFDRPHWTKICAYHYSGQTLNVFEYCDQGNEADTDETKPKNQN